MQSKELKKNLVQMFNMGICKLVDLDQWNLFWLSIQPKLLGAPLINNASLTLCKKKIIKKISRIWKTLNLSTAANSKVITIQKKSDCIFFWEGPKKI